MLARRPFILLPLLALLAIGCNQAPPGPEKVAIKGHVSLDGEPIPSGYIYFKDVAAGQIDAFNIVDGEFSGKAIVGKRRVEVSVLATTVTELNGMENVITKDTIPAKYNVESQLTATVNSDGNEDFTFDLKAGDGDAAPSATPKS